MNTYNSQVTEYAFNVCCDMYCLDKKTLMLSKNRKAITIRAKRLLIYFFYKQLDVKHMWMKKYFKDLHHATSIYHVKRFEYEIINYKEIKKEYDIFISEMEKYSLYGSSFYEKRKEIKRLLKEINKITND